MVQHISYFINNLISNIMVNTPFKISFESVQLLPDFLVVFYDETNYPFKLYFFVTRDSADFYFDSAIHLFDSNGANILREVDVSYIRLLSLHCIDDVYQYTSSKFYRVNRY